MTGPLFRIALLQAQDRKGFHCGSAPLDRYFQTQVSQDMRRRLAACYVASDQTTGTIAGFYTLSAAEVPITDAPAEMTRKLARYPSLPAARLGRLAVDVNFRGLKLGSILLADAVLRAAQNDVAVFAMIVDAKDAGAEAFYRHHGFSSYGSAPGKLIAPLRHLLPPTSQGAAPK